MSDEQWQPSEEAIAKLAESKTPRQLAAAYLRASRRARKAELASDMLVQADRALANAAAGDLAGCADQLKAMRRRFQTEKQIDE